MNEASRTSRHCSRAAKVDPVHQQAMRELLVKLLRAWGVKKDVSLLDNTALKLLLEAAVWGVK